MSPVAPRGPHVATGMIMIIRRVSDLILFPSYQISLWWWTDFKLSSIGIFPTAYFVARASCGWPKARLDIYFTSSENGFRLTRAAGTDPEETCWACSAAI